MSNGIKVDTGRERPCKVEDPRVFKKYKICKFDATIRDKNSEICKIDAPRE